MYTRQCTVLLLLGTILATSPATTMAQVQRDSGTTATASREVRRQAYELAQRFRRANDVILQLKIAEEAIQMGKPHAEKVLGMADLEHTRSLETYGAEFSKQIHKARRFTADGVVSSSKRLQKARSRLVQFGNIQTKLREFLKPNPGHLEPGDEETNHEAISSIEESLRVEEEAAVERWLLTQGYRRLTSDESSVISAINRLRQGAGLETLEVDYKLCFAALRSLRRYDAKTFFFTYISSSREKNVC